MTRDTNAPDTETSAPDSPDAEAPEHTEPPAENDPREDDGPPAPADEDRSTARRAGPAGGAAARARAAMQRRHLRLALVSSAAVGVEVAGAGGLVAAGLLPWEWESRLWGHGAPVWIATQAAVALAVLALLAAWLLRRGTVPDRARVTAAVGSLAAALLAAALLWQAESGSRGVGPLVAVVAGLLAAAGCLTWILAMRRLRRLFPFGLAEARRRGFGNLPAVRRAQFLGGPAAAVLAGGLATLLVLTGPAVVGTVDARTTEAVALSGPAPAVDGPPVWTTDLPSAPDNRATQVWATAAGLVVEEVSGVRAVDPATGGTRWHWRDEAYHRVGGVLTDGGATVVLALDFLGDATGRDKVVAVDTGTGQVRWQRYDDELAAAMATLAVAGPDGDWFMVPAQAGDGPEAGAPRFELRAIDSADGQVRWRATPQGVCSFLSVNGVSDVVLVGQQCPHEESTMTCELRGLEPATGQVRWTWPQDRTAGECQAFPDGEYVFVRYYADGEDRLAALAAATGELRWELAGTEAVALDRPILAGDTLVALGSPAPGSAAGSLLVHDTTDGQRRHEVDLPEGQPIGVVAADRRAVVWLYLPETNELTLVGVDPATGTVTGQAALGGPPEGTNFYRVSAVTGPATLATYALVGDIEGGGGFRLVVSGW